MSPLNICFPVHRDHTAGILSNFVKVQQTAVTNSDLLFRLSLNINFNGTVQYEGKWSNLLSYQELAEKADTYLVVC